MLTLRFIEVFYYCISVFYGLNYVMQLIRNTDSSFVVFPLPLKVSFSPLQYRSLTSFNIIVPKYWGKGVLSFGVNGRCPKGIRVCEKNKPTTTQNSYSRKSLRKLDRSQIQMMSNELLVLVKTILIGLCCMQIYFVFKYL